MTGSEASINIKESEVIKLILDFLHNRELHVSMLSLEKESGVINGMYSDDLLFLRQLILDGQWDDVLEFMQPLESIDGFQSDHFRYLILKHKFLEMLCITKSEPNMQFPDISVDDVVECLNALEPYSPTREEYSSLCLLLTLPQVTDHVEYKNWNPSTARVHCFQDVAKMVETFLPANKKLSEAGFTASQDRLVNLMIKGLLYESCVEFCQQKATTDSPNTPIEDIIISDILQGSASDEADLSLLSWLQSIPPATFTCAFEQKKLKLQVDKIVKPPPAPISELLTPVMNRVSPYPTTPTKRPRSADTYSHMTQSLNPSLDGLSYGLMNQTKERKEAKAETKAANIMSRSFAAFHSPSRGTNTGFMSTMFDNSIQEEGSSETTSPDTSVSDKGEEKPQQVLMKRLPQAMEFSPPQPRRQPHPPSHPPKQPNHQVKKSPRAKEIPPQHPTPQQQQQQPQQQQQLTGSMVDSQLAYEEFRRQREQFEEQLRQQEEQRAQFAKQLEDGLSGQRPTGPRPQANTSAAESPPFTPPSKQPGLCTSTPRPGAAPSQAMPTPSTIGKAPSPQTSPRPVGPVTRSLEATFNKLSVQDGAPMVDGHTPKLSHSPSSTSSGDTPGKTRQSHIMDPKAKGHHFIPVTTLEDMQAIRAVAFHPSGALYTIGSNSKTLRVCSYPGVTDLRPDQKPEQPTVLYKRNRHHKGSIYCIAWSPTGNLIATGSNDKCVKVLKFNADTCNAEDWPQVSDPDSPENDLAQGPDMELTMHDGTVRDLVFMRDVNQGYPILISGGAGDCCIYTTDCEKGEGLHALAGHTGHVLTLYAWGGCLLASGAQDKTIRLWDLRAPRCVAIISSTTTGMGPGVSPVASVCVDPSGRLLASGHEDNSCMLYDISGGRVVQAFKPHTNDVRSTRFSPNAYHLLTGSYDHSIKIIDLQGDLTKTLPVTTVATHKDKVIQCRWHPTENAFLSTSADRTVTLWGEPQHR
ncbi:WD repeat-containing protein 47-like isoform X1 [Branchiostoma floridae x Branchiostoma japonicum]